MNGLKLFFCLFCRKVLTLHRNWFTIIVMKRESGVNPEQSRCCNIPFLCKHFMPLDEKREELNVKRRVSGKAVCTGIKSEDLPLSLLNHRFEEKRI